MLSPELAKLQPEKDAPGLNFTETELTLGLPGGSRGGSDPDNGVNGNGKRGVSQTVDLSLGSSEIETCGSGDAVLSAKSLQLQESGAGNAPPAKTQVVGWPPVRSAWKNALVKRCMYVKVAVDGAPYLRKVDLEMYGGYKELLGALEKMFTCFTISNHLDEGKLTDPVDGTEYVPTYEDKDGDWMLVGDVPWKMFVESCKRLRLMKSSEAVGLAPSTPKRGTKSS